MLPPLEITIDASVAQALALGVVVLDGIGPRQEAAAGASRGRSAEDAIRAAEAEVRRLLEPDDAATPRVARAFERARRLYKRFGIDPTKYRPSCEQLARRIAKGEAFPRVNPIVDAVNLCQLEERLCYGLYDLDALAPPIVARVGRAGESYEGIRKGTHATPFGSCPERGPRISLEGKPALFDARGPFGNPTSDSDRAKTGERTARALAVVFGAPEIAEAEWREILERTVATFLLHVSAVVVEKRAVLAGGGK